MTRFSVLIATYAGDSAEKVEQALESIFAQTRAPDQCVMVVDGPIPASQQAVLDRFAGDHRVTDFTRVQLPENGGLGNALRLGFGACVGEWVLRMDSDDVAAPERIEKTAQFIDSNRAVDVVATFAREFWDTRSETRFKTCPLEHDDIVRALKWRNVIAHS